MSSYMDDTMLGNLCFVLLVQLCPFVDFCMLNLGKFGAA